MMGCDLCHMNTSDLKNPSAHLCFRYEFVTYSPPLQLAVVWIGEEV